MNSKKDSLIAQLAYGIQAGGAAFVSRHPSAYAYEYREIVKRLKFNRFTTAKHFLENSDQEFQRTLSKYRGTSAAATYSPHRPLDDTPYFVSTETISDLDILLPFPDGTPKATHVVHIGPKGSGKTTVQNQWLKTRHDTLESLGIFYVRCDAPKIFEFWERNLESPETWPIESLPTIEEYLDFQTLYILAKYNKVGLPQRIVQEIKEANLVFDFKEARAFDSPGRSWKPVAWYLDEHIAQRIKTFETGDPNRSYLRDSLFTDKHTKRREYYRWLECAAAVKKWMRQRGFVLLRILDGIDNLHINTGAGQSIFFRFLPEVRKFVLREAPEREIRFAVMRNRTWIEVLRHDPITLGSGSIIDPRVIQHIPPAAELVSSERIKWIRASHGNSDCAQTLEATAAVMPSGEVLHDNMRTLVEGTSSLAEQVRFRHHQLDGKLDIRRQATIQMKRNLFLNGRFFLSTERDFHAMNREKGLPYINPFWFPDDHTLSTKGTDPLFLRIRILELLNSCDILEIELIRILTEDFGYGSEVTLIAINDSRAFGWIDSKSEISGTSTVTFELSESGKYLLLDLLADIDVLYMLALDTRIPKAFFDLDIVQVHTNHLHQRSGYIGAATITVYAFVSWLTTTNRVELKSIKHPAIYRRQFLSRPALKLIVKRLCETLRNAGDEDWALIASKCETLNSLLFPQPQGTR